MKCCFAVVSPQKGKVELKEFSVPDPGANEIQVRVHTSLISPGTERAYILNLPNTPGEYPFQPGYCTSGIVEKAGAEVTGFREGDRVACKSIGHRSLGNVREGLAVHIPDGVSFDEASFMTLGQIAMQGVRKTRIELGEDVMVIGLGLIGQLALQLALLNGAAAVTGVDRAAKRLKVATECGADFTCHSETEGWGSQLQNLPQVVIESTGAPEAISTALETVRPFGRVSLLGSTRGQCVVDLYNHVHCKAVTIIGAHASHGVPKDNSYPGYWTWRKDAECFIKLLGKKKLRMDPLITDRVEWKDAESVYRKLLNWDADMLGAILHWN